jgi:hypothetical protein
MVDPTVLTDFLYRGRGLSAKHVDLNRHRPRHRHLQDKIEAYVGGWLRKPEPAAGIPPVILHLRGFLASKRRQSPPDIRSKRRPSLVVSN